eukprot:SAG22_NODE_2885_length_2125_cov_1.959033_1_plen_676_part_01
MGCKLKQIRLLPWLQSPGSGYLSIGTAAALAEAVRQTGVRIRRTHYQCIEGYTGRGCTVDALAPELVCRGQVFRIQFVRNSLGNHVVTAGDIPLPSVLDFGPDLGLLTVQLFMAGDATPMKIWTSSGPASVFNFATATQELAGRGTVEVVEDSTTTFEFTATDATGNTGRCSIDVQVSADTDATQGGGACSSPDPRMGTRCGLHGDCTEDVADASLEAYLCTCDDGYFEVAGTCTAGRCTDGTTPCGVHGDCFQGNFAEIYTCTCSAGYLAAAGTCEEIRPCDSGEEDCAAGAVCNHVGPGEHSCTCTAGYEGDGRTDGTGCADIDSCETSPCFFGVSCTDNAAPYTNYTCGACPAGFAGDGETCADIDDCAATPCGANGTCTDTGAETYVCACDAGFFLADGTCSAGRCHDGSTPCGAQGSCGNVVGGSIADYICTCDDNYIFVGGTCVAIDQCSAEEDDCVADAVCNHEGVNQHSCTCTAGHSGDGTTSGTGCTAVTCPANSAGTNVPTGDCTCNDGYEGTITATQVEPFVAGECVQTCSAEGCGCATATGLQSVTIGGSTFSAYCDVEKGDGHGPWMLALSRSANIDGRDPMWTHSGTCDGITEGFPGSPTQESSVRVPLQTFTAIGANEMMVFETMGQRVVKFYYPREGVSFSDNFQEISRGQCFTGGTQFG